MALPMPHPWIYGSKHLPHPFGHNNIICCSIMLSDVMHCAEACITALQLLQYYSYYSITVITVLQLFIFRKFNQGTIADIQGTP